MFHIQDLRHTRKLRALNHRMCFLGGGLSMGEGGYNVFE